LGVPAEVQIALVDAATRCENGGQHEGEKGGPMGGEMLGQLCRVARSKERHRGFTINPVPGRAAQRNY
jgi:hypothetical protein